MIFTSGEIHIHFSGRVEFVQHRISRCLATPCHTQDSICYYVTDSSNSHPVGVFTGDTLFIAGCGRFFEGVGSEMVTALECLGRLPDQTTVYVGHEYTKDNLAFGKYIDPTGEGLAKLEEIVKSNNITTGLTTIGDEKEWNVFFRLDSDAVRYSLGLLLVTCSQKSIGKQPLAPKTPRRVQLWTS